MLRFFNNNRGGILHTKKLVLSFVLILLVLLFLVIVSSINSAAREKSSKLVQHTADVIRESERVIARLNAIENNSRAYIITGWDYLIDSAEASEGDVREAVRNLKAETQDNQLQQERLKKIEGWVQSRIDFTNKTIRERQEKGLDAARKLLETGQGLRLSNQIRAGINQIQEHEEQLMAERKKTNETSLLYSIIITVVVQIFLFVMLVVILLLMIRGVKAQKESEKALRESSAWFSRTLAGIGDGVIATDHNGAVSYLNPVAESLTGWSHEEAIGKSVDLVFDIINETSRKPAVNPVKTVISEKRTVELDKNTLLIRKDKREIPIDDSAAPVFDDNRELRGVVLVFRDVEKQRIAERLMLKSNERFTTVFDLSPVAICITDVVSGKIVLYNSAFFKLLHSGGDSLTGNFLSDLIDLTKTGNDDSLDIYTPNGTKNVIITQQKIELDNRLCNVYVFADNTERKKMSAELNILNKELEKKVAVRTAEIIRNEKKFKALVEHNSDIILLSDADGNILYQSPSVERILGWKEEEYKNMYGLVLIHSDDLQTVKELFIKVIGNPGTAYHTLHRVKNKKGQYQWMEGYYINLQNDPDINAIVANLHDVTDRELALSEIKAARKRMEDILQSMGDAFVSIDHHWKYTFVNRQALQLMGKNSEQLLGKSLFEVFPDVTGTDFEINYRKVMNERVNVSFETYYPSYDMWLNIRAYPHEDGIAIFYTDISKEKNAQKEIIHMNEVLEKRVRDRTAELEDANRELESFSYSVSHDLKAPLRSIHGYTTILKEDFAEKLGEEGDRYIKTILKNTDYMGRLIEDLLRFSKVARQDIRRTMLNMDKLVSEIAESQRKMLPEQKIEFDIKPLIKVLGDESMIKQVMQNLISNAIKYSSKKEVSRIEIGAYTQGGFTTFYVKDNGAGFEMEYYDKLFAVFQRLHARSDYDGTGIGLALVNRIIQKHDGKVWAEGEVDIGATFYFSLPNQ